MQIALEHLKKKKPNGERSEGKKHHQREPAVSPPKFTNVAPLN
jgi:hypothetical protein